jgi:hypothetical protein
VNRHLDTGMLDGESFEDRRNQAPCERGDVPNRQPSGCLAGGSGGEDGMLGAGKQRPGMLAEGCAGLGQFDAAGVPCDQAGTDALLELSDLAA